MLSFWGQKDPRQPCLVLLKADPGPAGGRSRGRAAARLSHMGTFAFTLGGPVLGDGSLQGERMQDENSAVMLF